MGGVSMTRRWLPDITLIALTVTCLVQVGAQLFAVSMIARVVQSAPPRSFAILEGEDRYDSGAFWETVPPITAVLFLVALVANWNTDRRKLLLGSFALFLAGGAAAGLYLEPMFARMIAVGYRDVVDPGLQARAATWYALDWGVWGLGLIAGIGLLTALARPVTRRTA